MIELTSFEIDEVSGAFDWGQAGNAFVAFGGGALTLGNVPVAVVCGIAGLACYALG